jgi:hypothetical protein
MNRKVRQHNLTLTTNDRQSEMCVAYPINLQTHWLYHWRKICAIRLGVRMAELLTSVCGVTSPKVSSSSTESIGYPYRQLYCNFNVCEVHTGWKRYDSSFRSINVAHSVQKLHIERVQIYHTGISLFILAFPKRRWICYIKNYDFETCLTIMKLSFSLWEKNKFKAFKKKAVKVISLLRKDRKM